MTHQNIDTNEREISSHASIFKQESGTVATPFTSDGFQGVGR